MEVRGAEHLAKVNTEAQADAEAGTQEETGAISEIIEDEGGVLVEKNEILERPIKEGFCQDVGRIACADCPFLKLCMPEGDDSFIPFDDEAPLAEIETDTVSAEPEVIKPRATITEPQVKATSAERIMPLSKKAPEPKAVTPMAQAHYSKEWRPDFKIQNTSIARGVYGVEMESPLPEVPTPEIAPDTPTPKFVPEAPMQAKEKQESTERSAQPTYLDLLPGNKVKSSKPLIHAMKQKSPTEKKQSALKVEVQDFAEKVEVQDFAEKADTPTPEIAPEAPTPEIAPDTPTPKFVPEAPIQAKEKQESTERPAQPTYLDLLLNDEVEIVTTKGYYKNFMPNKNIDKQSSGVNEQVVVQEITADQALIVAEEDAANDYKYNDIKLLKFNDSFAKTPDRASWVQSILGTISIALYNNIYGTS